MYIPHFWKIRNKKHKTWGFLNIYIEAYLQLYNLYLTRYWDFVGTSDSDGVSWHDRKTRRSQMISLTLLAVGTDYSLGAQWGLSARSFNLYPLEHLPGAFWVFSELSSEDLRSVPSNKGESYRYFKDQPQKLHSIISTQLYVQKNIGACQI